MTIAFLIRSREDFYFECFKKIALKHPEHLFFAVCIDSFVESDLQIHNVKTIQIKKTGFFFLLKKFQVFRILQKIQANWFFTDSIFYFREGKIKQIICVDDNINPRKNQTVHLIRNAMLLIAHNEYIKKIFLVDRPEAFQKIEVLPIGISSEKTINQTSDKNSEVAKSEMDYFLIHASGASIDSLKICLKAFSIFKKWQKSRIRLVIFHDHTDEKKWKTLVSNYTYKEEIVFVTDSYEKYIKSCYATIFIPERRPIIQDFLMAIHNLALILLPNTDYCKSIAKEASLYFDNKEKDLSEKMIRIYKHEDENKLTILAAKEYAKQLDWHLISDELWSIFMSYNKL